MAPTAPTRDALPRSARLPFALAALAAAPLALWSQETGTQEATADEVRDEAPIARALLAESKDVRVFNEHVTTLASPWMEGRVPGTRGMELAREYVEHWMRASGVEPGFVVDGQPSWRQSFELAPSVQLRSQELGVEGADVPLTADEDYRALSLGKAGAAEGTPVFIGYGIERGPRESGYEGFVEDLDLTGKIAVMLRFEPMDEAGESRWSTNGPWSGRASFGSKVRATADRNPAAILIVNPPGCADERATQLNSFQAGNQVADVPVVHVNLEAGEALALSLDPEGRSLMDLRKLADEGPVAIEWQGRLGVEVHTESNALLAANIGGLLRGKGALADELLVMGAHMDHLGMGEFGSRSGPGELHPGADDNATGTAAILMLAERLKRDYDAMPAGSDARSILFLAFDAEESGLNGSRHYVENPIQPLETHALMLNFDMIGRLTGGRLSVSGVDTGDGLSDLLQPLFEDTPLTVFAKAEGSGGSDHLPFLQREIPALFAICEDFHDDYHTPRDTSDKINRVDAVHTIDLFHAILKATAAAPEGWAWKSGDGPATAQRRPAGGPTRSSIRVRFGIRPSDEAGAADHVAVGSVTPASPAEAAGLQAGDVLLTWNGEQVGDIRDWMGKLAQHEPGDEVTVVVDRGGEEKTLQVTLGAPSGAGG